MENEAKKAINLEDLDEVTGGFNTAPYRELGWDGKCLFCGCSDLEYNQYYGGYRCQNCHAVNTENDLINLFRKPGEAWV